MTVIGRFYCSYILAHNTDAHDTDIFIIAISQHAGMCQNRFGTDLVLPALVATETILAQSSMLTGITCSSTRTIISLTPYNKLI